MFKSIIVTFVILSVMMLISTLVTSTIEEARIFFIQTVAITALFMAVDRNLNGR